MAKKAVATLQTGNSGRAHSSSNNRAFMAKK